MIVKDNLKKTSIQKIITTTKDRFCGESISKIFNKRTFIGTFTINLYKYMTIQVYLCTFKNFRLKSKFSIII